MSTLTSLLVLRRATRQPTIWLALLLGSAFTSGPAEAQLPESAAGSITVQLVPDPVGGRDLLLSVEAIEVEDLYGLSFELEFPKGRLRWKRNSRKAGALLADNGNVETIVLDRQRPRGVLFVGAARLGDVAGASGSGVLMEIGFVNRKKAGPREIVLVDPRAYSSSAAAIPDIQWNVIPFQAEPSGD
jgi:hypothetical protein